VLAVTAALLEVNFQLCQKRLARKFMLYLVMLLGSSQCYLSHKTTNAKITYKCKSPQTTEHQTGTLFYKPLIAPRVSLALKALHLLAFCNQIHKLCLSGGRGSLFPNQSAVAKGMLEQ